ncbi:MAG: DUF262 domain-containing protein [Methanotrichaceae archaeon]
MVNDQNLSGIDLIEAVDERIKNIRTKSFDISFNELSDMYAHKELIIDPEYQRLFRWSEGKQSRFIESIILELPLPPIFVIEREEGVYELIDGLQRISSYLHFRGELHLDYTDEDDQHRELKLTDCDIAKELNGFIYEDLPRALKIKLKRNFIRVEVIRRESDPRLRYYMFKRLNTGGENLSDQEIRNCTIRLLDNEFNDFLIDLSKNNDFRACVKNLSDEKVKQKYDQELVLRFFTFKNCQDKYTHEVRDFMTEYMEAVSDPERDDIPFNYDDERRIFVKTFEILRKTLGEYAFSRTNKEGHLILGLIVYHYEAFTLGIQKYLSNIDPSDETIIEQLKHLFTEIKQDSDFRRITTGGGRNTSRYLQERIQFVEDKLGTFL